MKIAIEVPDHRGRKDIVTVESISGERLVTVAIGKGSDPVYTLTVLMMPETAMLIAALQEAMTNTAREGEL